VSLIAVARGDEPPDLVIENARVFSAFTREWLELDVAIFGGRIAGLGSYEGGERVDADGRWLVPGFIDAHVHIESSKLVPAELNFLAQSRALSNAHFVRRAGADEFDCRRVRD